MKPPDRNGRGSSGAFPLEGPATALLMSDGFYRAVDTFQVVAEDRIIAWAMDEGLAAILATVRRLEAGDAECLRYPRLKPYDDATALLCEIDALR